MSQPVLYLDVIGSDSQYLRQFYGHLFGWTFEPPSPVAAEVPGLRGGGTAGSQPSRGCLMYIGVPDVEAALQEAGRLGGARVMGPMTSPSGLTIGHFTDPAGTLLGVAEVI